MPVTITVKLKAPISRSLSDLFSLAAIWGFRVNESSTNRKTAKISIPSNAYERMFKEVPKKGVVEIPKPLSDFLDLMEIIDA